MKSSDGLKSAVSSAVKKREKKIISELIKFKIIKKTKHPITGYVVYLPSEEDILTHEVESFVTKVARLKPVNVKVKMEVKPNSSH